MADTENDELLPVQASGALPATTTMLTPEVFVEGLRMLQQRIPEFTHFTLREKQSMAFAANLEPEVIDSGIQMASVWKDMRTMMGRSAEELQLQADEVRRWELVEQELKVVLQGLTAANMKRRHELGRTILTMYSIVGDLIRRHGASYLRPYYENMRTIYREMVSKRRKRKKKEPKEEE